MRVTWVHLKRGVHLQPGDMVFEHMIERRRHVLAWRRLCSAIGLAWFRLRMWVRARRSRESKVCTCAPIRREQGLPPWSGCQLHGDGASR